MSLKCRVKASLGVTGMEDIVIRDGVQPKFPRSVDIRISTKNKLMNFLLKKIILPRKLFDISIDIQGW